MTAKTVLPAAMEEALEPTGTSGKKIGTAESDRYGSWYFSLKRLQSGRYVAKTKKTRLAGRSDVFCSAAESEALVVP